MRSFTLAGMRHVLRSVLEALDHIHQNGLVHADLKPCDILMKSRHPFRDGWRRLSLSESTEEVAPSVAESAVAASSAAAPAEAAVGASEQVASGSGHVPLEVTYQLPATFEVVLADLGQLACPEARVQWKQQPSDKRLPLVTVNYRPPDLLLGNQRYGAEVDMWSFGCVVAELYLREPLFPAEHVKNLRKELVQWHTPERQVLEAQARLLGAPPNDSVENWLQS